MSSQVLGGAVHDQINAKIEWVLVVWCGEGAVDHGAQAVAVGNRNDLFQVNNIEIRIGRRFRKQQPRVGLHCSLDSLRVTRWDHGDLDTQPPQHAIAELPRAPITVSSNDHVLTRTQ